jgi:hypothetical protein
MECLGEEMVVQLPTLVELRRSEQAERSAGTP